MSVSRVLLDLSRWRRHSREARRVRLHLSVLRIHFSVTSLGDAADDPETILFRWVEPWFDGGIAL